MSTSRANSNRRLRTRLPLRLVLVSFILFLALGVALDLVLQRELSLRYRSRQRTDTLLRVGTLRARLEDEVTANLLLIHGMAAYISMHPGLTQQEFARFSRELMRRPNLLNNLSAAPDYVLRFVYPLDGNEAILGKDYRDIPDQWEQASKPEKTGRMEVAGPLNLIQGGNGLIGRAPVFVQGPEGEHFWGLVSSVIDADRLLEQAGLIRAASDLDLALRGADGMGAQGRVFYGEPDLFDPKRQALLMDVALPTGSWQLAALPRNGWATLSPLSPWLHAAMAALVLVAIMVTLQRIRAARTLRVAQANLEQAQTIAQVGSWEFDMHSEQVFWSDGIFAILGLDKDECAPSVEEFMSRVHPEDQELARMRHQQALEHPEFQGETYRVVRPSGEVRWVQTMGEKLYGPTGRPRRLVGVIQDVTDRMQADIALREQEEKLNSMSRASHDALIMIDADDIISFWNPAAEKLFGYTADEAMGKKLHELISLEEECRKAHAGLPEFARTGQGPVIGTVEEFMAKRKDGSTFPVERSVASLFMDGKWYAVGSVRDITERKQAQDELRRLATTDSLTGLPNRRYFMETLEKAFHTAKRYGRPLSVLMFDVDHFKKVNDTYGHDGGDVVLEFLGEMCLELFRGTDTPGRIGGEEFAVVLSETDLKGAMEVAERLRVAVREKVITTGGKSLGITVSLGVATFNEANETLEELLKRADLALYRAKNMGRDRVEAADGTSLTESG